MSSLALAERPKHFARMRDSSDDAEAKLLGEALRNLRLKAKLSQEKAGERHGITGQAWSRYEGGQAPTIFKPDIQRSLVEAVEATVDDLHNERSRLAKGWSASPSRGSERRTIASSLPIRRRIRAGAWLAVEDLDQGEAHRYAAAPDIRFPNAKQWLSEVDGDSMDRLCILAGDLVHSVDIIDIGYHPRTGDIVEVERMRFQGGECEVSLKQVEVRGPTEILLWPRSNNPRWTDPLVLREGVSENEDIEIVIRGLVLSSIRRFHSI